MNRYVPFTPKGEEMQALGFDSEDIAEFESMYDRRGQQELIQRHPDAAQPEVMHRVGMEIANNADRYRRRLQHESPGELYEDAYARARLQADAAPAPDPRPGPPVRPGATLAPLDEHRDRHDRLAIARQLKVEVGEAGAARFMGYRVVHPDLDVDPRR